jgi:hypothetical protein
VTDSWLFTAGTKKYIHCFVYQAEQVFALRHRKDIRIVSVQSFDTGFRYNIIAMGSLLDMASLDELSSRFNHFLKQDAERAQLIEVRPPSFLALAALRYLVLSWTLLILTGRFKKNQ